MVEVGLDFVLEDFLNINLLVAPVVVAALLLLVALVEAVYVLERLAQWARHLLVEILMVPFAFLHPVLDELLCARLLDVVIKPRQVKFVHAEAHEVEEGLDVVDWGRIRVHPVLSYGGKHRVSLEVLDLPISAPALSRQYMLRQGEVNQIVVPILEADVVEL